MGGTQNGQISPSVANRAEMARAIELEPVRIRYLGLAETIVQITGVALIYGLAMNILVQSMEGSLHGQILVIVRNHVATAQKVNIEIVLIQHLCMGEEIVLA